MDGGSGPNIQVNIELTSLTLTVGESVTVEAQVTGGSSAIDWSQESDTDIVPGLAPSENSVTITALGFGTSYVFASADVGQAWDLVRIKVPPLSFARECDDASDCNAQAPLCARSYGPCSGTCTRQCITDADCPGGHYPCNTAAGVCRAIKDFDLHWP